MSTTPIGPLVTFCVAMTAIAVARLAIADERGPVDVGSALVVAGATSLTVVWFAIERGSVAATTRTLLLFVGAAIVCAGVGVMVRHWNGDASAAGESHQRGVADDADAATNADTDGDRDHA